MPKDHTVATEAEAVLGVLVRGLHERDAAAVTRLFASDARIFDLAPPLAHAPDEAGLAEWLAGWDAPVDQTTRDLSVHLSGDLAACHGLVQVRTTRAGEEVAWWMRATYVMARGADGWRIVHEHTSVPFHMDGSFRAAIDLEP